MNPKILLLPLWLIFMGYWLVTSFGVKRDIKKSRTLWVEIVIRIAVIVTVVSLMESPYMRGIWQSAQRYSPTANSPQTFVGLILCAAGIAFAIWARVHIGRNWSPAPAMKEEHELVTSGPYRYARHPIYTGLLIAMLGTGLVAGLYWYALFVIFLVMFLIRVRIEEGYMMKLFPTQYPEYRKRVKALIPFVA